MIEKQKADLNKQILHYYNFSTKLAKFHGLYISLLQGSGIMALFLISISSSFILSLNILNFNILENTTYGMYIAFGFRWVMNTNAQFKKIQGILDSLNPQFNFLPLSQSKTYNGPFIDQQIKLREKLFEQQIQLSKLQRIQQLIKVEFINVTFEWNNQKQIGIKQMDFCIDKGQIIALSARSGFGKSTILNLITKIYQPQQGIILINNKPIQQITPQFIQQNISYVTQRPMLISGTFRQNLCYGNYGADLSDENLIECLKATNSYLFVKSKGGLDGYVQQNGKNLSGGQFQRLMIARAFVKKPKLILLDQSTSNLDHYSQKMILEEIKKKAITTIFISHRIDTMMNYLTRIIKLEQLVQQKKYLND